jgi:hypothetical protein
MRSKILLFCLTTAVLATSQPTLGQGLVGEWGRSALPGAGAFAPPQAGGDAFMQPQPGRSFMPVQPGVTGVPWRPEGVNPRGGRGAGVAPLRPGSRPDGWRRRPGGYGVGLAYPYVDDYGEEPIEEPVPPPPPKLAAGPKTVSAPPTTAATATSSATEGSLRCGKGRRVQFGGGRSGDFGCISP